MFSVYNQHDFACKSKNRLYKAIKIRVEASTRFMYKMFDPLWYMAMGFSVYKKTHLFLMIRSTSNFLVVFI